MIEHVLREERTGAYWLIRRQGRALELDEPAYQWFLALREAALRDHRDKLTRRAAAAPETAKPLVREIREQGLDEPGACSAVRRVASDVPRRLLPRDALAAPHRIYFELTRACNLHCRTCFNRSGRRLPGELTLAEVLDVHRQAHELGVFEIRYTGGECTILPEFPEIVADARRRGFYVSLGTNGVFSQEQLEWLPHCGVDWFIISLDGGRRVHDAVRGAGTFDRALGAVQTLARCPAVRLRLNMVVARHNLRDVDTVARIAARHGAQSVNLIPLRPYGRSVETMADAMLARGDFREFIGRVNRLRKEFPSVTFSTTIDLLDPEATTSHDLIVRKKRTCAAGVEACVIGPQGHVYGCSYSPASFPDSMDEAGKRIFVAGDLREDDLRTIWRDGRRWSVFRDLAQYKHPKCLECPHYAVRCSGSCQIMAWHELERRRQGARAKEDIREIVDPYCFVDLLESNTGKA